MEAILLIIGFAMILSAVGYFFYTRHTKRTGISFYRRYESQGISAFEKIKHEMRENDQHLKALKETIKYSAQCRNLANKLLNEISGLVEQKYEGHPIRIIDLQVLHHMERELNNLYKEMAASLSKNSYSNSQGLRDNVQHLISSFNKFSLDVHKLAGASENELNDIQFLKNMEDSAGKYSHEITDFHEQMIQLFQKCFSVSE